MTAIALTNLGAFDVEELDARTMDVTTGGSIPFWGGCTPDYDIFINVPGRSEGLRDGYTAAR